MSKRNLNQSKVSIDAKKHIEPTKVNDVVPRTIYGETTLDPQSESFLVKTAKVLIISNNYYGSKGERKGNEEDKKSMEELFKNIGFMVTVIEDTLNKNTNIADRLSKQEVEDTLDEWSKNSSGKLDNADCLIVVIMSHGELEEHTNEEYICFIDGKLSVSSIYKKFTNEKCEVLRGKPKLFFIQACRGQKQDHGLVLENKRRRMCSSDSISSNEIIEMGNMAELFVAHPSFDGYEAYRDDNKGSWFIQSIAKVFSEGIKKNKELHQMMIEVNREVAKKYRYDIDDDGIETVKELNILKEVPCFKSTLTKGVFFQVSEKSD